MKTLLIASLLILTGADSFSAPLPPIKQKAIQGTVVGFVWMNEMQHEEDGVWNQGYTSEWAARYYIRLKAPKLEKKTREKITRYVRGCVIRHRILDATIEDGEMLLLVTSKRLKELKLGAALKIEDYEMQADEWGTAAIHGSLMIGGKLPTVIPPPYPKKATETKPGEQDSGGKGDQRR